MEVFYLTLKQMLMMFILIGAGFFLRKKKLIPESSGTTLAKLETLLFTPALSLHNMLTKCTVETFSKNWILMLYGALFVTGAILLSYPISALFVRNSSKSPERMYQRNIYKYSMTFANWGFMGNFLILGVWGQDMFYKYTLFGIPMTIATYAWGLSILIPKDENANAFQNFRKRIITPPLVAVLLGIVLGLIGLGKHMPDFVLTSLEKAGSCQGPVAMVLAGFVIGGYNFKELISNKKVYLASLMRLVVIPSAMLILLLALNANKDLMILVLVAYAASLGLNTIVFPEAYGGDSKTGASMAMISSIFAVATIPLMYLVFIVLV
jgi:predicted permease